MASTLRPSSTFESLALNRQVQPVRNTIIENAPQVSSTRALPHRIRPQLTLTSPMSEDFPTPKATATFPVVENIAESPTSSDTDSDHSSLWSKRSSSNSEFDDMYDLSGSESEFPIKLSGSVKKRIESERSSRFPSIVIPCPDDTRCAQKTKSSVTPLSPPIRVEITPSALARLQKHSLQVPCRSTAPSLDGSATSEELCSISSCPSTPDIENQSVHEETWEGPIRLDPSAISMLQCINSEAEIEQVETIIVVPEEATVEMREIVESPGLSLRLQTQLESVQINEGDDELSALSVPTPGGFFSSLDSRARHAWTHAASPPSTSTAANFYGVPFRSAEPFGPPTSTALSFYGASWTERPSNAVEHTITTSLSSDDGPVTARKIAFSPIDTVLEVDEIDECYDSQLKEKAGANIDRTQLWLTMQDDYLQQVCSEIDVVESFKDVVDAVPKTPDQASPVSANSSPSKKSVRFAVEDKVLPNNAHRISPIHDGTFWEGWQHQKRSARARDVFQHRRARVEAEHVQRRSCSKQHVEQLQGKYKITTTDRPATSRPISTFLTPTSEVSETSTWDQVERERQALHQLNPSLWHLQAQKEIKGGSLLTSPIVQTFKGRKDVKILDLAGQVHCAWAWAVAFEHPAAEVFTTVFSDAEAHVAQSSIEGPSNHTVVAAAKLWNLPFDDSTFDVVSARSLYSHLHTHLAQGEALDEWDLTLRECFRVLKPGGYLEFDLLDAELVHARSAGQALSVEFAFNLRTRGYDPCAGKTFLPRLKRAGFQEIKRAWMVLPVADVIPRFVDNGKGASLETAESTLIADNSVDSFEPALTGSTKDVRGMTGLVGGRNWEQWMLKLNTEIARSEERCLEEVAKAIEEGGKYNAAWKCLVGWARKDV